MPEALGTTNLWRALAARETGCISDRKFQDSVYTAIVPNCTFSNVSELPAVALRRFTPCGRFLVSTADDGRHLVVFQVESGGRRIHSSHPSVFDTLAFRPPEPTLFAPGVLEDITDSQGTQVGLLTRLPVPLSRLPSPVTRPLSSREDPYSCSFNRFFTRLYSVPIATGGDILAREFCLVTQGSRYLILATYQLVENEGDSGDGVGNPAAINGDRSDIGGVRNASGVSGPQRVLPAVVSTPVFRSFTLHLVHLESGRVDDRFCLYDDFVLVEGQTGVHLRGDTLCVLSVRTQTVHIIQVQESLGAFAPHAAIGYNCHPDDALTIATARDAEMTWRHRARELARDRGQSSVIGDTNSTGFVSSSYVSEENENDIDELDDVTGPTETGLGNGRLRTGFYSGLMQRILVYLFRRLQAEGRQAHFCKVVDQYSQLLMHKVQLLDDDHLLIRLGSYERNGRPTDPATNTCFFVVYCISSTAILNLFDNRAHDLLVLYDRYRDMFVGDTVIAASLPPHRYPGSDTITTTTTPPFTVNRRPRAALHPVSGHRARAAYYNVRGRPSLSPFDHLTKHTRSFLATLPFSNQARNPSPYLDRSLFSYSEGLLPALDGSRALPLREAKTLKFRSTRTGAVRFKLAPVPSRSQEDVANPTPNTRTKMLFLFHPHLPLVLSTEYGGVFSTRLNIHVYGHDKR